MKTAILFAATVSTLGAGYLVSPPEVRAQGVAVASQAQVSQIDKRVTTLEGQMRAVQRQVFPGGDKRFFAPEITAAPQAPEPANNADTAPLAELLQRVTALEAQQRDLTGQIEQLQFKLRQTEQAMAKWRGDTDFRLEALEKGAAPASGAPEGSPAVKPAPAKAELPVAGKAEVPATSGKAPAPATASKAPAASPEAAEAEYRAGYALYTAGKFADAEARLSAFAAANPTHPRASNAQFWAGRSLLAEGKTAEAAKAFLNGYQKFPKGERAHNSLLYLGKALLEMKQSKAACQALEQLQTAYPDRLTGAFAADTARTMTQAGCKP